MITSKTSCGYLSLKHNKNVQHLSIELEELLELVAAWSQERKPPAQHLYTALGWRYRSSPRRKRRENKREDTRVPVPLPDPSLLILFAVPHDLDTSWCLPYC